jgi:hypothetical protein
MGSRPSSEPVSCAMAVPAGNANEANKANIITIRCIPHPRTFPGPTTHHPHDAGARVQKSIFSDINNLSTVTYELIHIFFAPSPHALPINGSANRIRPNRLKRGKVTWFAPGKAEQKVME